MFSKKNRCYNGGKQHKFTPRYEETPNMFLHKANVNNMSPDAIKSLFFQKVYIKDVCEWCGKEIKK